MKISPSVARGPVPSELSSSRPNKFLDLAVVGSSRDPAAMCAVVAHSMREAQPALVRDRGRSVPLGQNHFAFRPVDEANPARPARPSAGNHRERFPCGASPTDLSRDRTLGARYRAMPRNARRPMAALLLSMGGSNALHRHSYPWHGRYQTPYFHRSFSRNPLHCVA